MNILYIVGENLYPTNSGGRKVAYQRLEYLAKNNNVFFYCFYKGSNEKLIDYPFCIKCYYKKRRTFVGILRSLWLPYIVASRSSKKIDKEITKICLDNNIELIVYEQSYVANVGKKIKCVKKIIDSHNVEYEAFNSLKDSTPSIIKKMIYHFDSKRLYSFEKKVYRKYIDGMTFISKLDEDKYLNEFELTNKPSTIISYGVKRHKEDNAPSFCNLVFVGSLNYAPNNFGAIWLSSKVMPLVLKKRKDIYLYIVGKNPSDELKSFSSKNIIITGQVESVDSYYKKCGVVLIPIFQGGGLKVKLVEASSYNRLIIATSDGVKGSAFDKNDVIIANNEEEFAQCIIDVVENRTQVNEYIHNMKQKFEENYNEDRILAKYEDFLKKI